MNIAIAADHAGVELKRQLVRRLRADRIDVLDLGIHTTRAVDYPDCARMVAEAMLAGRSYRGILICGSAVGVSVAACKFPGIRATCAHDTYTAHQCVEHDQVNVVCLGGRVIGPSLAGDIIRAYLQAEFTGEERHERRLAKIDGIEREFLRDDV